MTDFSASGERKVNNTMEDFILIRPTSEYASQIVEYRQEFLDAVAGIPEYLRAAAVRQKYGHLLPHGLPKNPDLFYLGYCHGPAGTTRFLYKLYEITGKEAGKD